MRFRIPFLALLLVPIAAGQAVAATSGPDIHDTRLLTEPAISADRIAFIYAGDLWTCGLNGQNVRRLTSDVGFESSPAFSPDGKWIAFSAQYEGNTDVYLVSADGGVPKRLTWHPGNDVVQGFTADGSSILFTSPRAVYTSRYTQLFTVPLDGGPEQQLEIPNANRAVYSADGRRIAYNPGAPQFLQWKRYRGGAVSQVWLYDVASHAVEKVPQPESRVNDAGPMWVNDAVYFRSDREGEFNLYSYDPGNERDPPRHEPLRFRGHERVLGRRPDRVRAGGVSPPSRPGERDLEEADDRGRRRPAGDPSALREGNEDAPLHPGLLALSLGRADCGGLSRRDRHGPGGKGGRAQPDQHAGRARAFPDLVARRPVDRVLLGRVRRLRALDRKPGRQGRTEEVQAVGRRLLRIAGVVARQQEDRLRRQCARPLLARRFERRLAQGRGRLLLWPEQDAPSGLVAGLASGSPTPSTTRR